MNCELDIENVVEVEMIREILRKHNDILLLFFDEIILNMKTINVAEINEFSEDINTSSSDEDEEKWD
tara:strand:- start:469 stop:669 length:201 start_codon:yes stop_codon:yes gene_type:complete